MGKKEILRAIEKLSVSDRMLIVEKTLKSIRETALRKNMEKAAEALLEDYNSDKELTAFTAIDFESFYEAR